MNQSRNVRTYHRYKIEQGDHRQIDCDICDDRYTGEDAISAYIREKTLINGDDIHICIKCISTRNKQRKQTDEHTNK